MVLEKRSEVGYNPLFESNDFEWSGSSVRDYWKIVK